MGVLLADLRAVSSTLTRRAAAPEQVCLTKVVYRLLIDLTLDPTSLQAGIFAGDNPAAYNAGDPIRLWIIQVGELLVSFRRFYLALTATLS